MGNKKLNIKNNISLKDYQKKHKNFSYKLMSFTEKEVNEFDKANGRTDKSLLKGKKWCKIDGKYYQLPKASVFNWFRNLNAAGKSAVCLLTCGVVAGAAATPFLLRKAEKGTPISAVHVDTKKGITSVVTKKDATTGNIEITVTPEKEEEAINKDSVKLSYKKAEVETPLEEDQYDIEEDTKVIIAEEVQEEHPGEELIVTLQSTLTDTPENYELKEETDPETGEEEVVAEVDEEDEVEEVCVPSKGRGKAKKGKKKIDKIRVKQKDRRNDKLKKLILSNDIKNIVSSQEGKGAFEGREKLEYARMPDRLSKYGDFMFQGCPFLKEIKGGKYTKELGQQCFANNFSLEKFIGKNIEKMGMGCFANMSPESNKTKLAEVHLSDKLDNFPTGAFYENRNLRRVKGGKNAKEVGESCYHNCFSLKEVDILMSRTLEKVGIDAFRNTSIEKLLINEHIDMGASGSNNPNSFKNNGMLANIYVENRDFANRDKDYHDRHGALDNAKKVHVKKDIQLTANSAILSRFIKNEDESKKDNTYDIYDAPSTGDKRHQTYTHYYDLGEGFAFTGYRYTGKEENMKVPQKQEMIDNVKHVNSHGLRDNKNVKTVDLRVEIEQGQKRSFFTSIGTDMDNGHSFHGCEFLEYIFGLELLKRICSYSFMGTALREFTMPAGVSRENLGKGAFNDHKTKQMTLTLQKRTSEEEEIPEEDQLYNNEDDDSGMYDASETVYVPEDADVKENSYLKKNYEKQTTTTGQKQKWVKKQK